VGSPERKRGRATGSALVPQRAVLFKVASPLKTVDGDRGISPGMVLKPCQQWATSTTNLNW